MALTGGARRELAGFGNRITDDQRKVLKHRTGFKGYTSYLQDYTKKNFGYGDLLSTWKKLHWTPEPGVRRNCKILDLTKVENSLITFDICCSTKSHSELFTALSEPRAGVYGRIVLWRIPRSQFVFTDFLEDLGLVLEIAPAFLRSLYARSSPDSLGFEHLPVFAADHVMVGDMVATMTRCRISARSSAVPIVFIADTADPTLAPAFIDPVVEQMHLMQRFDIEFYGKMITGIIGQNMDFSKSANTLMLPTILADMHVYAYNLRALCCYTTLDQNPYRNTESIEARGTYSNELRRRLEEFEDMMQDALTGFNSIYGAGWSTSEACEGSVDFFKQTINRARRFEAILRDSCQVKIGQLSLEESKKSIELSASQAEEGKRGELRARCNKKLSLTSLS